MVFVNELPIPYNLNSYTFLRQVYAIDRQKHRFVPNLKNKIYYHLLMNLKKLSFSLSLFLKNWFFLFLLIPDTGLCRWAKITPQLEKNKNPIGTLFFSNWEINQCANFFAKKLAFRLKILYLCTKDFSYRGKGEKPKNSYWDGLRQTVGCPKPSFRPPCAVQLSG